jgi:threonine aldolase
LGADVKELTRDVDSVSFCLSKGLAAPVGSVICGSGEFIAEARRNRKVLGGGMRQCGIIAAAGIIALEQMVERLTEDHANARRLAEGIAEIAGLSVDLETVQTNMVYFDITSKRLTSGVLVKKLAEQGIKILSVSPTRLRAVTHYGITTEDIEETLAALQKIM